MIGVIYLIIAIACWLPFAIVALRHFDHEFHGRIDTADRVGAAAIGVVSGFLWPLVFLVAAVYYPLTLLYPPKRS